MGVETPVTELTRRVEAARSRPPLSSASADDMTELAELLAVVRQFEGLPGKWQAAILAAELGAESHCCH